MSKINQAFSQCCGMPMGETDALYRMNSDGSKNEDYCSYCFENGEFMFNGTMEEMIEICVPHMTEEGARTAMCEWFPTLKRWKNS